MFVGGFCFGHIPSPPFGLTLTLTLSPLHLSALHPVLTFLPPQTSHRPLPLRASLHFLTHYVSLENFLLCSICPFPTSPTPFQQTHPLNGCSPYRHAGPGVLSVRCAAAALPRLNSRGRARPPQTLFWTRFLLLCPKQLLAPFLTTFDQEIKKNNNKA